MAPTAHFTNHDNGPISALDPWRSYTKWRRAILDGWHHLVNFAPIIHPPISNFHKLSKIPILMSSPHTLSSSPTDAKAPPNPTNPFNSRTVTYIRIGPTQALRVIIFLRRKDWEWFDKSRLQKVVQALFPLIPAKLNSLRGVAGKEAKDAGLAEVYRDGLYPFG